MEKALWGWDLTYSLAYNAFDTLTRVMSPYQMNPFPDGVQSAAQGADGEPRSGAPAGG